MNALEIAKALMVRHTVRKAGPEETIVGDEIVDDIAKAIREGSNEIPNDAPRCGGCGRQIPDWEDSRYQCNAGGFATCFPSSR